MPKRDRRRRAQRARARTPAVARRSRSAYILPLFISGLVLLATIDDRHVGRAADERQIIWTAVAVAETGQLGQARGRDFTYVRPDGKSVSRFGLGMSLLEVPAALLAAPVERALGPGSSQPLFLIAPLLLVLACGAAAGAASRHLGAGPSTVGAVALLTVLGSPVGSYAAMAFSEPLQAFALVAAYASAFAASAAGDRRLVTHRAFAAGFLASVAVLAKSSNLVVAPAALLPLLVPRRAVRLHTRVLAAGVGVLPGLILWAALDVRRFGRVFGGYAGEQFNHAIFDGAWRLLVGPNLGLVLFFPATLVALWAFARAAGKADWSRAIALGGAVLPFAILLLLAAGYWAWHGGWGWGPRYLVPAIPLLAAAASVEMNTWRPITRRAFLTLSIVINIPGLLQHPVPVAAYISNLVWPAATAEQARSLAGFARTRDANGTYHVSPDTVLSKVPLASQFIVFPWFLKASWTEDADAEGRALAQPPWREVRSDLVPRQIPMSVEFLRSITGYPRRHFFGRGFFPSRQDSEYAAVYDEGLADQVIRLHQKRDGSAALQLAERLVNLAPNRCNDALVFESYRILGDRAGARAYLNQLPLDRRACPSINVVLALFERDARNPVTARQALESVAFRFPPDAPLHQALNAPLEKWPADLQSMIATPVQAAVSRQ